MPIQVSELINLALALAVLPLIVVMCGRTRALLRAPALLIGYYFMLVSYALTVLEGVGGTLGDVLNFGEHLALLCAGVAFVVGAQALAHEVRGDRT